MSLRRRLAIGAAIAVALAVAAASLSAYLVTRTRLLGDVDQGLQQQVARVLRDGNLAGPGGPPLQIERHGGNRFGGPQYYSQAISPTGTDHAGWRTTCAAHHRP